MKEIKPESERLFLIISRLEEKTGYLKDRVDSLEDDLEVERDENREHRSHINKIITEYHAQRQLFKIIAACMILEVAAHFLVLASHV